jgi:hypothetical protein
MSTSGTQGGTSGATAQVAPTAGAGCGVAASTGAAGGLEASGLSALWLSFFFVRRCRKPGARRQSVDTSI